MAYYAVYDVQLGGFKAEMSFKTLSEAVEAAVDRIFSLHQDYFDEDEECEETMDSLLENKTEAQYIKDVLPMFDYEIKTVDKKTHDIINESDEIGLLTVVSL